MKKYIPYIVIFLIGAVAGMCLHRPYHFREATKMLQIDTLVRYDTVRYSRLELSEKIGRLNVPKITNPRMVLIPADSTTIIYRDSVRYVTLPRQYYFTETEDAQIWHSGIDSTIDSLLVFRNDMVISKTETTTQTVTKRNALFVGLEAAYMGSLYTPVYVGYEYSSRPWIAVYGRMEYDLMSQSWGGRMGFRFKLQW